MTFNEFALEMYPFWILGIVILLLAYFSRYRHLIRIESKPVLKWVKLMLFATIIRILIFSYIRIAGNGLPYNLEGAMFLPWQTVFTVFWEDAVHTLPIAIAMEYLGTKKWYSKLLFFLIIFYSMVNFGLGHLYQGEYASLFISFYIPVTLFLGRKYGFGTIMLCHVIYDLLTILTINLCLG